MTYSWSFKSQFAKEFVRYPQDQQDKILEFTDIYESHGLGDFAKFTGKITPSWSGLDSLDPIYSYAKSNALWHYHIGIPEYQSNHSKFKTSDWVLHFQWIGKGEHIDLVDICYHYKADGSFHLPAEPYLV